MAANSSKFQKSKIYKDKLAANFFGRPQKSTNAPMIFKIFFEITVIDIHLKSAGPIGLTTAKN